MIEHNAYLVFCVLSF